MKTYVLTVSQYFPKTHSRAGELTNFVDYLDQFSQPHSHSPKIHTIRNNYNLWKHRIDEINKGNVILSVRFWTGKPYNSKQKIIFNTNKVGIQKLNEPDNQIAALIDESKVNWEDVAKNDGLSFFDFCEWFKNAGSEPMAVIHFTDFRY